MPNQYFPNKVPSIADQNAAFYKAMFRARRKGLEHFTVGVCETPCTERPVFVPLQGESSSFGPSPAQLCAECSPIMNATHFR